MSNIIYSFNDFDEENIKAYPFYVGHSAGVVIDQRLVEDANGNINLSDTFVVTSGLAIESKEELAEFLTDIANELLGM